MCIKICFELEKILTGIFKMFGPVMGRNVCAVPNVMSGLIIQMSNYVKTTENYKDLIAIFITDKCYIEKICVILLQIMIYC